MHLRPEHANTYYGCCRGAPTRRRARVLVGACLIPSETKLPVMVVPIIVVIEVIVVIVVILIIIIVVIVVIIVIVLV